MRLNKEQQQGVDATGHCLISACPGSGKTRVLIQRAQRLLNADPNNKVALITFTKEAAGEISSRLVKALPAGSESRYRTGTFHAIAMKQINESRANAKPVPLPPLNILNDHRARILLRRAWLEEAPTHKWFQVLKSIEKAKATQVEPIDRGELKVLHRYRQLLAENKSVDFADLVIDAVKGMMLKEIPILDCTHLLIDEFQDVDQTQLDWVLAHVNKGVKVTAVGDDDQSVYKFRHALGFSGMTAFLDATDAQPITLDTTYRCSAQVMTMANRLIVRNPDRIRKSIKTAEPRTGIVERYDFSNEAEEALGAGRALNARPMADDPAKQCTAAILARTNSALNTVEFKLREVDIKYYRIGGGSIWDEGVPCMMRDMLSAFHGKNGAGIVMLMHAMQLDRDLIRRVNQETRAPNSVESLLDSKTWQKGMGAEENESWHRVHPHLLNLRDAVRANKTTPAFKLAGDIAARAQGTRKGESIARAACNYLDKMGDSLPEKRGDSLKEVLRTLDRRDRKSDKHETHDPRHIALMTLHGSKGLEFDRVWIMGVNHGVLPHADSEVEEERRLCYVGMTRAKTHLMLSTALEEGKPSQFFEEMGMVASNHQESLE